jgi:SAM-dependent methyltransferase
MEVNNTASSISIPTPTRRNCPACEASPADASLFLEDTIDSSKLSASSFSSRKSPEFMSHKLVRCLQCDLVYVDTPPCENDLADAYHAASYDSSREADDAALSYATAIAPTVNSLSNRVRALEIGTGTGIFLEHLSGMGFSDVIGIEPSVAAIAAAPLSRRSMIRCGVFVDSDYPPESFDLICCFMTMEHVQDPGKLARAAHALLRDGGVFVTVTHDYRSWINRMLGAKSPIIDVEHMQLFSNQSINTLFTRAGFVEVHNQSFRNRYALDYWVRLAPIPTALKRQAFALLEFFNISDKRLSVNVGNQITVGFRRNLPTKGTPDDFGIAAER